MHLFFLTIPKPLKQHPIFLKKIIHSAFRDVGSQAWRLTLEYLEEKLSDSSVT